MSTINDNDLFLVERANTSHSVTAENLMSTILDTDLMLVERNGVSYKVTGEDVKEDLGGIPLPDKDKQGLDCDIRYNVGSWDGNIENAFDGDLSTTFKPKFWYSDGYYPIPYITFPAGLIKGSKIEVYLELKNGAWGTGNLVVNDATINTGPPPQEKTSWYELNGVTELLQLGFKNTSGGSQPDNACDLAAIRVDGEIVIFDFSNCPFVFVPATTSVDDDIIKIEDESHWTNRSIERTQWQYGSGSEGNQSWLLVNEETEPESRKTLDFTEEAGKDFWLREWWSNGVMTDTYLGYTDAPPPWVNHSGGILHIKNVVGSNFWPTLSLGGGDYKVWDIDGTNERRIREISPGEEVVVATSTNIHRLFFYNNTDVKWEFGEETDVSRVKRMSELFNSCTEFNADISDWDVSNVENMDNMFASCRKFNQDLSSWDTSNVTTMRGMFNEATAFNHSGIRSWNTSNVTDMRYMFTRAENFNQNLSMWDTSKVTQMNGMFEHTKAFNQNISRWNTKSVTNMYGMFSYATAFNQDLSQWCVSSVQDNTNFADGASSYSKPKPVWGTCPRGEDS